MNLNKNYDIFFKPLTILALMSVYSFADISGTVFRDYNANGLKDSLEVGVADINVTAYSDAGISSSVLTDANGNYTLTTGAGDYRVELTNLPSYLEAGTAIAGSTKALTSKVSNGATHNVGLNNPADYSESNPNIVVTRMVKGAYNGVNKDENVILKYSYLNSNETDAPIAIAKFSDVGSVYGVAHLKRANVSYVSSYFKRHSGMGPAGVGAIYKIDHNAGDAVSTFATLSGTDPRNADDTYDWNHDNDGYTQVGKTGLGDMELSDDESKLFVVNMEDRKLYVYNLDAVGNEINSSSYAIPNPCENDIDFRPMALGFNDGVLYAGVTCTAESTVDADSVDDSTTGVRKGDRSKLSAHIYSFNPLAKTFSNSSLFDIDLTYGRGCIYTSNLNNTNSPNECTYTDKDGNEYPYVANWNPWQMDYDIVFNDKKPGNVGNQNGWIEYPQPMLADIVFDNDDSMIISIRDINGDRTGSGNASPNPADDTTQNGNGEGDILRACGDAQHGWTLESNGECGGVTTGGANNNEGLGGGEFYWYDNGPYGHGSLDESKSNGHSDTVMGGILQIAGYPDFVASTMDVHGFKDNGLMWLRNDTGEISKDDSDVSKRLLVADSTDDITFGKASGMGDIELLSAPAPIEIGNYVWDDSNGDGIQDPSESGIENVVVKLYEGATEVGSATTDADGYYYFGGVNNKNMTTGSLKAKTAYQLRINLDDIAPKQVTLKDSGEVDSRDSDGDNGVLNPNYSTISYTTGTEGENNHDLDFGFTLKQTVSIGSLIWEDLNRDGLQDDGESGIADVNVTLLDENGTVMPNPVQKTGADGQYYFSDLDEGTYSILLSPPSGMGYVPCTQQTTADNDDTENDSNIKSSNGNEYTSGKFTLQAGTEPAESNGKAGTDSADDLSDDNGNMTVDFCFYRPASLGDYVWYDKNKNGTQDANETGVEGVKVELLRDCSRRGSIETTTTDVDGKYKFTNLTAGDYCVEFSNLPADYMVTTKGAGSATDSDASTTAPFRTEITTLDVGEEDLTWDMGIYSSKVAIGDRVWYDTNKNGQQDAGETGVANIEVKLLKDCTTEVNTTTTDASGNYIFDALSAGTYCLEFGTLPDGFVISPQDSGDDATDSDVNATTKKTASVTLDDGARDLTWDMGIYAPASLGDKVWNDKNANGIQDADELPVQGVDVTLLGSDCATAVDGVDPQTTDENGLYLFEDLVAGDYCVRFTNISVGYAISPQNQGDDIKDSDVNVTTGITTVVTLNAGDDDRTLDMGIYEEASIGNYVWNDANANGKQDSREEPVTGVTVTLYDADCRTVAKDSLGRDIPVKVTDADGLYKFEHLMPSEYCLGFSTLPDGYGATFKDTIADDSKDSDVDTSTLKTTSTILDAGEDDMSWDMGIFQLASIGDRVWYDTNRDGVQDSGELGVPNATVILYTPNGDVISTTKTDEDGNFLFDELVPNDYVLGFDVPSGYALSDSNKSNDNNDSDVNPKTARTEIINLESGEHDISWDAGIYQLSSLGDYVWYDENHDGIQDANEPAVKDVKVTLYESDCTTKIAETRSDAEGKYLFENLEPDDYCVGFDELPTGYQFTPNYDNTGAGSELDCNVDPGTGKTPIITLPYATDDMTWDMGIIPKCKDEQDRVLHVYDDSVVASTTGSVTTVNVLANDHGNLDVESIRFVTSEEAKILHANGTAVGGVSIETSDKLVVEGEGVWTVLDDGTISFKAEDGFTGVPTPVYYVINCKQGSISNVGKVAIVSNCVCDTYEESMSDSVSVFSKASIALLLVLSSLFGAILYRKELQALK